MLPIESESVFRGRRGRDTVLCGTYTQVRLQKINMWKNLNARTRIFIKYRKVYSLEFARPLSFHFWGRVRGCAGEASGTRMPAPGFGTMMATASKTPVTKTATSSTSGALWVQCIRCINLLYRTIIKDNIEITSWEPRQAH